MLTNETCLALVARVTQRTDALEAVDQVDALAAVATRVAVALVDIHLAVASCFKLKFR